MILINFYEHIKTDTGLELMSSIEHSFKDMAEAFVFLKRKYNAEFLNELLKNEYDIGMYGTSYTETPFSYTETLEPYEVLVDMHVSKQIAKPIRQSLSLEVK